MQTITAQQMRDLEQAAIDSGVVTGLALMERAGQGVVAAVVEAWPALAKGAHRAVVLCGPGNNGGDGFVVARLLKARGWEVDVYAKGWDMLWRDNHIRTGAPSDARTNAEAWKAVGGRTAPLDSRYGTSLCAPGHVLVVDALLGIGQDRDTTDILRNWWQEWDLMCNASPDNVMHLVSIDVPTGYDADTVAALSANAFEPDLIVTFHAPKPAHANLTNVVVKDIGL